MVPESYDYHSCFIPLIPALQPWPDSLYGVDMETAIMFLVAATGLNTLAIFFLAFAINRIIRAIRLKP